MRSRQTAMTDYLTPLTRPALEQLSIPAPWAYGIRDRVRFYELDALNHVNNTAYLRWFETLRIPYVRDYGLSDYGPDDPQLVLMSNSARYLAPMFLGDDYVVTGRTAGFRNSAFRMEYAVFRGDEMTCAGEAVVVVLSPDGSEKCPIPDAVRARFLERDGAVDETA